MHVAALGLKVNGGVNVFCSHVKTSTDLAMHNQHGLAAEQALRQQEQMSNFAVGFRVLAYVQHYTLSLKFILNSHCRLAREFGKALHVSALPSTS